MKLSHIVLTGFKSFAKKTTIDVTHQVTGVVGPNGSGKSNIAEAIRFVLGEQSMKTMRGKIGTDVIFKGSAHLPPLSRASVTMVIDNRDKGRISDQSAISESLAPYLVYDEITLSRTIYADGTSDYGLNDAKVRLKDVQELLSFAGIGSSAHTIINQGEADRILLAGAKDRKEALLDALGLRVYHMRLHESSRKLEKVKAHVREVELLRNEIKPHLDHLLRQVKKIESQEEERQKLKKLLTVHFKREGKALELFSEKIKEEGTSHSLSLVLTSIEKELALFASKNKEHNEEREKEKNILEKERLSGELRLLSERRNQMLKTIGRLEAEKLYLEKELAGQKEVRDATIPLSELASTRTFIDNKCTSLNHAVSINDTEKAVSTLLELTEGAHHFFDKYTFVDTSKRERLAEELVKVEEGLNEQVASLERIQDESKTLSDELNKLSSLRETTLTKEYEEEKKIMLLESKLRELKSTILLRTQQEGELALRKQSYEGLLNESVVIVGREMLSFETFEQDTELEKHERDQLLRLIERTKLRIEESSIPNKEEVLTEYKNTKERDEYLSKELGDIEDTETKLLDLIKELEVTLHDRFSYGIEEIGKVFGQFFGEIFPGGKARLVLTAITKIGDDGEEKQEEGVELDVSLPNKKVKELSMFSGGERALVSIALLFAMSQVTPPPFMVLDETDAPLDESNARKYGAMLNRLSMNSKLLVITHNRETMNHCDMLYGVTVGVEGASKLLSINFKEAEKLAQ